MPINQTYRQSDLEKRLKILRRQIYGKNMNQLSDRTQEKTDASPRGEENRPTTNNYPVASDVAYLRADLTKISLLAGAAFTLQIISYFLIRNNLLNLNLF